MKRKILHIVFSLASGGLENMVVDMANCQSKKNTVSLLIINDIIDNTVKDRLSEKVRVVKLGRTPGTYNPFSLLQIYKIWFDFNPDIVHIHCQQALHLFPKVIFNNKQTTVFTIHDTDMNFGKEINNAEHIFAISNAVKQDLWDRQALNSQVIYNGIPLSEIPYRTQWQDSNEYRLLQISRLVHDKKGQDLLIEAVAHLKMRQPELLLTLDFIGGGESESYLRTMVKKLNICDRVRFLGVLPKSEVYECLHNYEMLIQPSRYEGFGLTIAEAMAANVPVIVSDIEGPLEVIDNGRCGQVFASGRSTSLAESILNTIDLFKSGEIQGQVESARERACRLFDINKTAEQYAAF